MTESSTPRRAAAVFIFLTVALDVLAIGLIIPVLPNLIAKFYGGNVASAASTVGWFGMVFAVMQFICMPILGALSDQFGRRPIVLLSNLGLGLDYILMALAPTLGVLLIGRILSGAVSASISTAYAYIADVSEPTERAAAYGKLGAAFGLGFVIGPALGGVLGEIDLRLPFWVAATLSLMNFCYGYFVLPESLPHDRRSPFRWAKANPIGAFRFLYQNRPLQRLASVQFLTQLAHVSLPATFVLYGGYRYGWSESTVGFTLAAAGVCSAIVQGGLVKPIVAKIGERRALLLGLAFGALGFSVYGLAPTGALFWVGLPLMSLWGLATPSIQSLMTQRCAPTDQGRLQGALGALTSAAGIVGPLLFAGAFAFGIAPGGAWHLPGSAFLLAALCLFSAGAIAAGSRAGR
jgi:MFS transporter, DHA1 family, tetracycline resistance protein